MDNMKFSFAKVSKDGEVQCYKEQPHTVFLSPLSEYVFENVTITFNDNNSITVDGDCWQYGLTSHDEYPNKFDYEIHPDYIELTKFRKKPIVRSGWHRKKENHHKNIILNKYSIVFQNE